MKRLTGTAALTLLLSAQFCAGAQSRGAARATPPLEQAHQAYEKIIQVPYFAFGGVGIGGVTSEGEKAFRTIAASTNALPLFRKALANGSDAAKLYALCGIRLLDKRSFDSAARALMASNPEVSTMTGCFVGREQAGAIVKRIAEGAYEIDISGRRPSKP